MKLLVTGGAGYIARKNFDPMRWVEPDAARKLLHVGTDFFCQIGDLVGESYFGARNALVAYLMRSSVHQFVTTIGERLI